MDEAYRLAVAHQRTVYDAMCMAMSVHERCPYVTADERLYNAICESFTNIMWVADWLQSPDDRA
ncbi:MAG: type II toxin-antitoxin system VapC family toxin [bacterium]